VAFNDSINGRDLDGVGHSVCAEASLAGPALWTATTRDGRVAEWRVYPDTPDIRAKLEEPAR
jgi:ketosteroid isomerase-like protein